MSRIYSFPPIIEDSSRVLILGSMPGVESLRLQQYYANPRNQFWTMIYSLFGAPVSREYEERICFLKGKKIALWDVIENCQREGSLDSNIRAEKVNDFPSLFNTYPNLSTVLFNGGKAYETYKRWVGFGEMNRLSFIKLSSSSPANTKKFEEKLKEWSIIRQLLAD